MERDARTITVDNDEYRGRVAVMVALLLEHAAAINQASHGAVVLNFGESTVKIKLEQSLGAASV